MLFVFLLVVIVLHELLQLLYIPDRVEILLYVRQHRDIWNKGTTMTLIHVVRTHLITWSEMHGTTERNMRYKKNVKLPHLLKVHRRSVSLTAQRFSSFSLPLTFHKDVTVAAHRRYKISAGPT